MRFSGWAEMPAMSPQRPRNKTIGLISVFLRAKLRSTNYIAVADNGWRVWCVMVVWVILAEDGGAQRAGE